MLYRDCIASVLLSGCSDQPAVAAISRAVVFALNAPAVPLCVFYLLLLLRLCEPTLRFLFLLPLLWLPALLVLLLPLLVDPFRRLPPTA